METGNNTSIDVFDGIQPSNEIWYTTLDCSICSPLWQDVVDNKYENGKGVIVFDKDLKDEVIIFSNDALTAISFPSCYTFDVYKTPGCFLFLSCKKLERIKYSGGDGRFLIVDDCLINVANSNLESVDIPDGVKVLSDAFLGERDRLEVIRVGKGSSLMEGALHGLSNLKKIYGDNSTASNTSWIENNTLIAFATGAHNHCDIRNGVTRIGRYVFSSSHLESVSIPPSVSSIGHQAFGDLTKVRMTGENVDKNNENLVVDGNLLLHFQNPRLGYYHPAVIPEGTENIDSFDMLIHEDNIVFPSSLKRVNIQINDTRHRNDTRLRTFEFLGTVPPSIHFRDLSILAKERERFNRDQIRHYAEWKNGKRSRVALLAFYYQQFENGFVPTLDDTHILLRIIVPKGSLEDYRRALCYDLEQYEKVIEISEK